MSRLHKYSKNVVTENVSREHRTGIPDTRDPHQQHHETWDFNEYNMYVTFSRPIRNNTTGIANGHNEAVVYVRKRTSQSEMQEIANLLFFLDEMTRSAQNYCIKRLSRNRYRDVFIGTKHTFYELSPNPYFQAVNKPHNVHECTEVRGVRVGKDGTLRSHERSVMLTLNVSMTSRELKALYIHEIAHSFCNHVLFRENDHDEDFRHNEKDFKRVLDMIGFDEKMLFYTPSFFRKNI